MFTCAFGCLPWLLLVRVSVAAPLANLDCYNLRRTHFLGIGAETRNKAKIRTEKCSFIGKGKDYVPKQWNERSLAAVAFRMRNAECGIR